MRFASKYPSWPGLTRPPSARTSVRAGNATASSVKLRFGTSLSAAQTRGHWVAGSNPAMTILFFAVLFLCLVSIAHAVEPDEKLADPALEARARALTAELRCVVCQNQSVDDSDAPLAKDIRVLVRERITAGDTDEEVIAFIVARYGRFVLLKPPLSGDTVLLWFGPGVLLVLGLGLAYLYVRRLNRAPLAPQPLSPAEEDAVKRIIEDPRA
jgi:cytochrome c-type biogenesis protein CcmH